MPQIISCAFCQQQFTIAEDQFAGYVNSQVTCSACNKTFSIVQEGAELRAIDPAGIPPIAMPYAGPEQGGQTNGLALAGLICSIAGLLTCGMAGIAGLVCSILGLRKSRETGNGRGMAIAGIVIGAMSLLFVPALLISIMLPSLARAREKANQIRCASNLRQIGQAAQLYAQDNPDLGGPFGPGFDRLVQTQSISPQVFQCPSDGSAGTGQVTGSPCSYIWLGQNLKTSSNPECVLAYEPLSNHGKEGANFLFADGHTEFIGVKDAAGMILRLGQGKNPPEVGASLNLPER
jgi:prepilin-type processing-associated H-X9-DG protein